MLSSDVKPGTEAHVRGGSRWHGHDFRREVSQLVCQLFDMGPSYFVDGSPSRLRNANRAWKRLEFDSVDQVLAVPFGDRRPVTIDAYGVQR